jgi:hypothetical protein
MQHFFMEIKACFAQPYHLFEQKHSTSLNQSSRTAVPNGWYAFQ